MKRFLVTTALEETWRFDEPILFLGEWCRRYSRKDFWSTLDYEVLPYHWDDRVKLFADYQYLQEFYERLLQDLAIRLNEIHGVDHGSRYWRILIGPWLGYFCQILFDRWTSIELAVRTYDLSGTCVLSDRGLESVPNDMAHFTELFVGDRWNHHICASIMRRFFGIVCESRESFSSTGDAQRRPVAVWNGFKSILSGWPGWAASAFADEDDFFFISTYLPPLDEFRLQWRLGQFPQIRQSVSPIPTPADNMRRQWAIPGRALSKFELCARALIPTQIPTVYLEGYDRLIEQAKNLPWPNRPRGILTSTAYISDDVFKVWAAEKSERGSALVIGQHGGHDGVGRWSFVEDHGISISDRYLSWGWADPERCKVRPMGQLKAKRPSGIRHAAHARALLVVVVHPRYSYFMYSTPVASQWLGYFADQFAFVEQLPRPIREALTVRLYPHDWGWDQALRWRDRFPTLTVDDGHADIDVLIRQSRLYISTYNATTFLESFNMDVPTVIYWNPKHWELRDSAIPYFEELERVGIFHETPESAARHVEAIWDDVGGWWSNPDVKAALERFKSIYCRTPTDLAESIDGVLREVAGSSNLGPLQ